MTTLAAFLQSMYSLLLWHSHNARSAASLTKWGMALSRLIIIGLGIRRLLYLAPRPVEGLQDD
jgi:hypothetical protein